MRSELFYCIDIIKDGKTVAITEFRIIIPIDDNKVWCKCTIVANTKGQSLTIEGFICWCYSTTSIQSGHAILFKRVRKTSNFKKFLNSKP
jgi:hypothetical protein